MIHRTILLVLVASTLAACADTGTATNEVREEKAYVTGSNIPRKSGGTSPVTTVSREEAERIREDLSRTLPANTGR